MPSDIIDEMWDEMQAIKKQSQTGLAQVHTTTEQAQFVDGIPAATKANLPSTGLANGTTYATVWFCSNGRKSGEGVGSGTGVPVYWNAATSKWFKFSDDTEVTV